MNFDCSDLTFLIIGYVHNLLLFVYLITIIVVSLIRGETTSN